MFKTPVAAGTGSNYPFVLQFFPVISGYLSGQGQLPGHNQGVSAAVFLFTEDRELYANLIEYPCRRPGDLRGPKSNEATGEKDGIGIRRDFATNVPVWSLDAQKIKQVLMNLILNARQAMPDGGTLSVRTRWQAEQKRVILSVRDTGTGIEAKNLERIFDPFFTTKGDAQGTGLGLSISYGIVKQHGGEIVVDSTPGKGATFTVRFPLAESGQDINSRVKSSS